MKAAIGQAAPGTAPREDITNHTSSIPSDLPNCKMQEFKPVDIPETNVLPTQSHRLLPTTSERESTAINCQAKPTNDDTLFSTTAAPALEEHYGITQSETFRTEMPATAEASADCLCSSEAKEAMYKRFASIDEKLDKILKKLEDEARCKEIQANRT
ncbi:hypothetical protein THARTR1_05723 [Trichoderma harzianum]|uniref:Uncharacterized protein n=1 Tax=Trichoderma harzianum TaxID=5544 RepID=A0A2K0U807_TRIHA|nr:hypothetical protein THARTR1_05723 [Trichoderma harzianum]